METHRSIHDASWGTENGSLNQNGILLISIHNMISHAKNRKNPWFRMLPSDLHEK
jgi:hypothetical protein